MNFNKNLAFGPLLFFCIFLLACSSREGQYGLEWADIGIGLANGQTLSLRVELARSAQEQSRGLMYRKSLKEGRGMLFIFDQEEYLHFWMKNTYIPLSIAYADALGRIIDIQDMQKLSLDTVSSRRPAKYALEVPQGWFRKKGISEGDRLIIQAFSSK